MSKRVLGDDHPNTIATIANLASIYRDQGRGKEAEELGVQVVETSKKVLGDEHPDTLRGMNNLALTWMDLGRVSDALELMQNCLRLRQQVLGSDHHHTVSTCSILESWMNWHGNSNS
jgi:hypothetical protein